MPFRQELIEVFVFFGTIAASCYTIDHIFNKIRQNKHEIEFLSSRLEECEKSLESSQVNELKK